MRHSRNILLRGWDVIGERDIKRHAWTGVGIEHVNNFEAKVSLRTILPVTPPHPGTRALAPSAQQGQDW